MKYIAIMSCSLAALLVGASANAWQDQKHYTRDPNWSRAQSHTSAARAQPSAPATYWAERTQAQSRGPAGQTYSYSAGAQPTRDPLYVRVPSASGGTPALREASRVAPDQPPEPIYQYSPPRNPYYTEGPQLDMLSEAIDWFISIPAGVVSRFADAGETADFPEMPATHGSGQDQTTLQPPVFYDQSVAGPVIPQRSRYRSRRTR